MTLFTQNRTEPRASKHLHRSYVHLHHVVRSGACEAFQRATCMAAHTTALSELDVLGRNVWRGSLCSKYCALSQETGRCCIIYASPRPCAGKFVGAVLAPPMARSAVRSTARRRAMPQCNVAYNGRSCAQSQQQRPAAPADQATHMHPRIATVSEFIALEANAAAQRAVPLGSQQPMNKARGCLISHLVSSSLRNQPLGRPHPGRTVHASACPAAHAPRMSTWRQHTHARLAWAASIVLTLA